MKHLIEWLLITTVFAVGALLSHLLLGYTYQIPLVLGLSLGYGLHILKSIEDGKSK